MFSEDAILNFLLQYAYMPYYVYGFVIMFMLMSGFGFPIPEEVVLVASGLIAYMAHNPQLYPPPDVATASVNVYLLAGICFFAVILSDTIVYWLGRKYGTRIFLLIARVRRFFMTPSKKQQTTEIEIYERYVNSKTFLKINELFRRHGSLAVGIFRFTPGIRFPGHLSCGIMQVPLWKFWAVDIFVALLSVPTQVLLVAFYGEIILDKFKEFKLIIFSIAAIGILIYFYLKYRRKPVVIKINSYTPPNT